ncbi:MAG: hypothetical protein CTY15_05925 [Methylocystis sp.]|nr:MAG: hypothetical protein CTY15_05925 [Methylocystis sp.]
MRKLRQEFSQDTRREKVLALQPFCQEPAALSGGILSWPRPGLSQRLVRQNEANRRSRVAVYLQPDS